MSTTTTTESFDTPDAAHAVHTAATSVNGAASGTQTWTYDSDGRPTGIDNTGGAQAGSTQTLAWTPSGRLANLSTAKSGNPTHDTSYGYDAMGGLVSRTDDGVTTLYLGSDTVTVSDGTVSKVSRAYAFPGGPTAVREATTSGTRLHWQTADPQGTGLDDFTADSLSLTRRTYTPFGQDRAAGNSGTGWAGDKGFLGGVADGTTGLTNLGAREYCPGLGRFLDPDPLLAPGDPQQFNGYAYANNDPVNQSDASGQVAAAHNGAAFGWTEQDFEDAARRRGDTGGVGSAPPPPPARPAHKKCGWLSFCKVKQVGNAALHWAQKHPTLVSTVVSIGVGVGCGAAIGWTGVGAVACGALAGAVGSAVSYGLECSAAGDCNAGDLAKQTVVGAVTGAIGERSAVVRRAGCSARPVNASPPKR